VRVLVWHQHGSWMNAFTRGRHSYLVPVLPGRPPDGRGRPARPGTFDWPSSAVEVTPSDLRDWPVDVVVLQRPSELPLAREWTGRDLPAVYVEHNTPRSSAPHPAAGWPGVTVAHVTHFNALMWDCGPARTVVIEHGIPDPGYRYTGSVPAAAAVINEPLRRGRVTGTDLLGCFDRVDLFGMGSEPLGGRDLPYSALLDELPRRRVYLHPVRWTSLGLSLIEAMHLGMPVVAVAATEAPSAVPHGAGVVSASVPSLVAACRRLIAEPSLARSMGLAARAHALSRYGLGRFLASWDTLLGEVVSG
jgi:hypothetical protein